MAALRGVRESNNDQCAKCSNFWPRRSYWLKTVKSDRLLVLLVQALIERELRRAMQREQLSALPLYPEERATRRPTAEQILRLFSHTTRSVLRHKTEEIRRFDP